ncbi:hypothetical protein MNBD_GAMMA13-2068 [hydrothermal vent metagenome]|uniref:Uncharacterized protein n=1 Tax=hydrothermal vent metagenome TaxID=652676 RepID=A0A3B0Z1V0_9ZZZZ
MIKRTLWLDRIQQAGIATGKKRGWEIITKEDLECLAAIHQNSKYPLKKIH